MTALPASQLLDVAVAAARAAGRHALANSRRRTEVCRTFKHDVKLKLDLECQARAEQVIRRRFPAHAILGEESRAPSAGAGVPDYQWVIDPIDGTVNFSHGLPHWCASIAVRRRGRTIAGVVFAPAYGDLYTATRDGAARLNGKRLEVSAVRSVSASLVMTGVDRNINARFKPLEIFTRLAFKPQKARVMGAAAIDICQVACGRAEAYFETGIFLWDIAAAGLIVDRAGGTIQSFECGAAPRLMFLATNGRIHAAMLKLLGLPRRRALDQR